MSNKLLIIEDNLDDFNKIKEIFEGWQFLPENHEEIFKKDENFNKEDIIAYINDKISSFKVSAIIMDIALKGEKDEVGLDIIASIRDVNDYKNKTIPIYCYSNYATIDSIKNRALTIGATNIFPKDKDDIKDKELIFLKRSLTALALNYVSICGKPLYLKDINEKLQEINEKIEEIYNIDKVNLQALLKLLDYQNIVDLTEINDTNEQTIVNIIGQEAFNNLKQAKWRQEDAEQQKKLIENIEELVSIISGYFPVLLPFVSVFKLIKLFVKMK